MPETITIRSAQHIAQISTLGAELKSVKSVQGTEFMWQGDADIWPRTSPVLFPIVGKVKNDLIRVNGVSYGIGQHGFVRDMKFAVIGQSDDAVKLQLLYNDETLRKYPSDFKLLISYQWLNDELVCGYEIENVGVTNMPFSIGAHPGFNIPEGSFEGYYLEFEKNETASRHLLSDGLFNHQQEPVLVNNNKLTLHAGLFEQDAIVFKNLKSTWIKLKHLHSPYSVKIRFNGFPYFGIWAKKGTQRFICLEPWIGLADTIEGHSEFSDKEGVKILEPHCTFATHYSLSFNYTEALIS